MDDDEIRRRLRTLAARYGPADELRARVRGQLGALDDAPDFLIDDSSRHDRRRWLAAAAVLAVVAGAIAVATLGRDDSGRLTVTSAATTNGSVAEVPDDSRPASTDGSPESIEPSVPSPVASVALDASERFVSQHMVPALSADLSGGDDVAVSALSESEQMAEFEVASREGVLGRMLLVQPSVAEVDSPDVVVEALRASLAVTELVDVGEVEIGGRSTTLVRMEPAVAMTLVGFRLGPRTFVSASGVNRSYEVYVVDRPDGGVLVAWVDAPHVHIDAMRAVVDATVGSVDWR